MVKLQRCVKGFTVATALYISIRLQMPQMSMYIIILVFDSLSLCFLEVPLTPYFSSCSYLSSFYPCHTLTQVMVSSSGGRSTQIVMTLWAATTVVQVQQPIMDKPNKSSGEGLLHFLHLQHSSVRFLTCFQGEVEESDILFAICILTTRGQ